MAYVKTVWAHDTAFTTTNLNNCETQYDDAYGYAVAHNHDDRYYTRTEMDATFWYAGNDGAGSGCDADLIYYAGGNKHYADFGSGNLNTYTIIMWDSDVMPDGWTKCDGTAGTPDLRDCFVLGAGTGGPAVGASGGNNAWYQDYAITVAGHALTSTEMPAHTHPFQDDYCSGLTGKGGGTSTTVPILTARNGTTASTGDGGAHGHTGSSVTINYIENMPPNVALHYIMKT